MKDYPRKNVVTYLGNDLISVTLTKNQSAIFDKADLEIIKKYSLFATYSKSNDVFYVKTHTRQLNRNGSRTAEMFANVLLGHTPDGKISIDHINNNVCIFDALIFNLPSRLTTPVKIYD